MQPLKKNTKRGTYDLSKSKARNAANFTTQHTNVTKEQCSSFHFLSLLQQESGLCYN